MVTEELLRRLEVMVSGASPAPEVYEVQQFAKLIDRSPLTVRAWLRAGRLNFSRKLHGRGKFKRYAIPHAELLRYQREGLLPAVK